MVSKIFFILLIILLSLVGFAAYQNPQAVDFTVFRGVTFHVSLTVLVLFAFCLGALIVLIVSIIRDTRRSFRLRKERKAHKREIEKLTTYAVILERLIWGNVKDIENRLTAIHKDFQAEGRFLRIKAELYKKKGQWREAYQIISQLRLTQEPSKFPIMMEEAHLAKVAGLPDKALSVYKEILAINSVYLPALEGIREILSEQENWEEIIPIQERIIKASSKKTEEKKRLALYQTRYARQLLVSTKEEDTLKGLELAKSLLKKDPGNTPLYVHLGNYYRRIGKTRDAIKLWDKAFSKTHHPYFLLLLESLFADGGKTEEILKRYAKATREHPESIAIAFYYAKFCLDNDKVDVARKVLEDMPDKAGEYYFVGLLKARILAQEGKKDAAFKACSEVVQGEKWLEIPLVCRACGTSLKAWRDECPSCGEMNTIMFNVS